MEMDKNNISFQVRNRLNTSQNAKLKAQKQLLKEKQQLLAEKKKEVERLKATNQHALLAEAYTTKELHKSPERAQSSPGREFNIIRTPPLSSVRREQVMSSASKKRHSSIFEVKTRQLVEEESKAFRELYSKKLDFDEIDEETTTEMKQSQADTMDTQSQAKSPTGGIIIYHGTMYSSQIPHSLYTGDRVASDGGKPQAISKAALKTQSHRRQTHLPKRVHFTADSLILNAALEGDLNLLKKCTREVKLITTFNSIIV